MHPSPSMAAASQTAQRSFLLICPTVRFSPPWVLIGYSGSSSKWSTFKSPVIVIGLGDTVTEAAFCSVFRPIYLRSQSRFGKRFRDFRPDFLGHTHGLCDGIATHEEGPRRQAVRPRLRDTGPRIVRCRIRRAALRDEGLLDEATALVTADFAVKNMSQSCLGVLVDG